MEKQIADRIDEFIKHVRAYLSWAHVERIAAEHLKEIRDPRGLLEANRTKNQAGADIRLSGPPLARALEASGRDSTGVLRIVHCADGGGGPLALASCWADVKIALQQIAIQHSDPNDRTQGSVNERVRHSEPASLQLDEIPEAPPLSDSENAVLRLIRDHPKGITGNEITVQLQHPPSQSTLTRHIIPKLKRHYAVKNRRGVGYYIPSV